MSTRESDRDTKAPAAAGPDGEPETAAKPVSDDGKAPDAASAPRPDAQGPGPAERLWQFLTLLSIGSLFAVFGMQRLFSTPDAGSLLDVVILAVQTLPLLICVPSLLGGSARAAVALAFLSLLYMCGAVITLVEPAARLEGSAMLLFALMLFLASTLYSRQRGLRRAATGA